MDTCLSLLSVDNHKYSCSMFHIRALWTLSGRPRVCWYVFTGREAADMLYALLQTSNWKYAVRCEREEQGFFYIHDL